MRMSKLFGLTLRAAPAEAESVGHQLLLRAAYIRPVAPGIFSYLPLGLRAMRKIEAILRDEIEAIGGQEIAMPLLQPETLRPRSRRLGQDVEDLASEERVRFADRTGRYLVVATTHEETAAHLARSELRSYRQLPAVLYQIRTSFRDEAAPRAGLLRAREFDLLASYSFDRDQAGRDARYVAHYEAFSRAFQRLRLDNVVVVASDRGPAEEEGQDFIWLGSSGDDTFALCDSCGQAASQRTARFAKPQPASEPPLLLEKVATPGADTIAALAQFLGVSRARTAKVVFFSAAVPQTPCSSAPAASPLEATVVSETDSAAGLSREIVVMALVRGDMEVSVAKLQRALDTRRLRPADEAAIRRTGAVPGFASPIGLASDDLVVVADDLVAATPNLISGANAEGFHYRHVNHGRDYKADMVTDIAAAFTGAPCPDCRAPLRIAAGVELGSLHKFRLEFSRDLDLAYQGADGQLRPTALGSYGIGVGRLLACIAEEHHDDKGLRLPASLAPYHVHLVAISGGDAGVGAEAEALYAALREADVEVLYDDREASAGVKFNDADLIGLPVRITLGSRTLQQGGVELKRRRDGEGRLVRAEDVLTAITGVIDRYDDGS